MRAKLINEILNPDIELFNQFKEIVNEVKDSDTNDPFYELNQKLNPLNIFLIDFKQHFDTLDPNEQKQFFNSNMIPKLGIRICGFDSNLKQLQIIVDKSFDDKFIKITKTKLNNLLNKIWSAFGHETIHMQQVNKMKVKQNPEFKSMEDYYRNKQEVMAMAFSFIEEVSQFYSKEEILNILRNSNYSHIHPLLSTYKIMGSSTYKMFTKYAYQYLINKNDDNEMNEKFESYLSKRFKKQEERNKKLDQNRIFISKEEAYNLKPAEFNNDIWLRSLDTFDDGQIIELKDVIKTYHNLLKAKMQIYGKYGKR